MSRGPNARLRKLEATAGKGDDLERLTDEELFALTWCRLEPADTAV